MAVGRGLEERMRARECMMSPAALTLPNAVTLNAAPHGVTTPTIVISSLLPNCNFVAIMNHNPDI